MRVCVWVSVCVWVRERDTHTHKYVYVHVCLFLYLWICICKASKASLLRTTDWGLCCDTQQSLAKCHSTHWSNFLSHTISKVIFNIVTIEFSVLLALLVKHYYSTALPMKLDDIPAWLVELYWYSAMYAGHKQEEGRRESDGHQRPPQGPRHQAYWLASSTSFRVQGLGFRV